MNKIFTSFLIFILIISCGQKIEYPWSTHKDLDDIFDLETSKLVLIDFETDW